MNWMPWLVLPVSSALIGYVTNWLAIRMLFRPRQRVLGFQGLLPRRQPELAKAIGDVVGGHLVQVEELLEPLRHADLGPAIGTLVDTVIARKVDEFRKIPLIGALITPERLGPLRDGVVNEIRAHQTELIAGLANTAREHLDVSAQVRRKVAGFDLSTLENLVQRVAARELVAIEIWGGILGFLIGLLQAACSLLY